MKTIQYIRGDATSPQTEGKKIIAHICNDIGGWGKGFVKAISNRWSDPENEYRNGLNVGEISVLVKFRWFRLKKQSGYAI